MHPRRHPLLTTSLAACALLFAGCMSVTVQPEGELPDALVVATPAKVGVVVSNETANYIHKETRASVDYEADLGPAHKLMVQQVFEQAFAEARMFDSVDAARIEPGLHAIFEPRIEQFSFAMAKETGGVYCAVTIRYQILIYAPTGELIDTLSLTGYGSGPAPQIGNGEEELSLAGYAAMRDAAAKFLTQFTSLEVAKPLLASQALKPRAAPEPGSAQEQAISADALIEAVPINDPPVVQAPSAPASTPVSIPPASPAPETEPSESPPPAPQEKASPQLPAQAATAP
jgi:hypothetical protein